MNVHLMIDNIYCERFISYVEENYKSNNNFFVILTFSELKYVDLEKHKNIQLIVVKSLKNLISSKQGRELFKSIKKSDKVIIHYLTDMVAKLILLLGREINYYWLLWGADLYSYIDIQLYDEITARYVDINKKNFKNAVRKYIEKRIWKLAVCRLKYVLTYVVGDYKLLIKSSNTKVQLKEFFYPNPINFDYLDKVDKVIYDNEKYYYKNKYDYIIQIGNSGDPTNNHLDSINIIKNLNGKFAVMAPLSYGNKQYIDHVIEKGYEILGNRFIPITEYLSLEDYTKILNQVDVCIMNHNRQQGFGNILALLYLGKKVYLKKNTTSYETLKSFGLEVYSLEHIVTDNIVKLVNFNNDYKVTNKDIISKKFSKERTLECIEEIIM